MSEGRPRWFFDCGGRVTRHPTAFGAHADAFMGLLATFTVLLTRILRKLGHRTTPSVSMYLVRPYFVPEYCECILHCLTPTS